MTRARARASALLLLPLLASGCGGASDTQPRPQPQARAAVACDPSLERGLRAWAQAGFSGSIAISSGGRLECAVAYGTADRATGRPNTPQTVFSIGSISKAVTAAAIADLVDAGRLSLSDRAGALLPALRGPAAQASVRQLLLHTSGLVGAHGSDHVPLGADGALAAIGSLDRAFAPGSDFAYSNAGYTLLALIVERVSGASYRDYVAAHLLRLPDGTVAGGFWDGRPRARGPRAVGELEDGSSGERGGFAGPHWAVEGNGGLAMTMPQLGAWTHALLAGELLSPRATRIVSTPGFRRDGGESEAPGWVVYDASVFGQPVVASAGGGGDVGQNAVVVWLPRSGRTIAIASNTPAIAAERLLQAIGPALAAGEPPPPPRRPAGGAAADPAAHAGTYVLPGGGSFAVAVRDGALTVAAHGRAAMRALFPSHPGYDAAQVAAHERAVLALLAGATGEGRRERRALESALGPLDGVELEGSLVRDGELRTYVVARSGGERMLLWYALNEQGAVGAAEGSTDPPAQRFAATGGGRFAPDDPTGAVRQPVVTFDGRRMTLTRPGAAVTATKR